ncbi:hypothetical protein [Micromonospora zhanjiangensis]|uniref:CLASP N-terminal domain-containing protein n=1 Tax=Micromonospora zhanjiangensis TaxID=1522057 RepID=A0ABV8KW48_9ACTN
MGGRRAEAQERRRQERVEKAAEFCVAALNDGWADVVSERVTDYVTEATWEQLFSRRRRRRCKLLAQLAAAILAGKKKLHDLIGAMAGWLVSLLGGDRVVQSFARQLASNIPLPPDAKMVAAARGLQVVGVLLCIVNGDELTRCQCFIDLALEETKTQVKKILLAAMEDWTGLAQFPVKPLVLERGTYGAS